MANAQIRVAVNSSGTAQGTATVAQLNDDTYFDFEATLVSSSDIDEAEELANYDVVIIGDSGSNNNDMTDTFAAALKTWTEAGLGGVVSAGWIDYATRNVQPRDGDLDDVIPVDASPFFYSFCGSNATVTIIGPAHPVTDGITTLSTTSNNVEHNPTVDATNGISLGTVDASSCTGSGDRNAIVVGEAGLGRAVYLGPLYLASTGYNTGDLRSGDGDRLLEQAVAWASMWDLDDDGVANDIDNCPNDANSDQADVDEDDIGDICDDVNDLDLDGDDVLDTVDNCPDDANTDQADLDEDGIGDICDPTDDSGTTSASGDGDGGCNTSQGQSAILLLLLAFTMFALRRRVQRVSNR